MEKIIVIGGGIVGLFSALVLSRQGHLVTLCEQDGETLPQQAEDVIRTWRRSGVPQATSVHVLLPLGRNLLQAYAPDVLARAIAHGASEMHGLGRAPEGITASDDTEIVMLACRRPVLEAALRNTVLEEGKVNLLTNCRVTSLLTRASGIPGVPQVTGIRTHEGEDQLADVVIDTSGRRSQTAQWLEAAGARPLFQEFMDCGLVYYSRHFRCRDTLPYYCRICIGVRYERRRFVS